MSDTTPKAKAKAETKAVEYKFLKMTPSKLAIMSLATFGLYEVYWMYKNWKAVKEAEKSDVWPVPRAIFVLFFMYTLLQKMNVKNAGWLTTAYILLGLTVRIDNFMWCISFLSFLPLLTVQETINKNQKAGKVVSAFSTKERIVAVIGGLLFVLNLVATATGLY
jgi:hypothetical protein